MELLGDPYQSEFPELIEDTLSLPGRSTAATVTAFNRKYVGDGRLPFSSRFFVLAPRANASASGATFSPLALAMASATCGTLRRAVSPARS